MTKRLILKRLAVTVLLFFLITLSLLGIIQSATVTHVYAVPDVGFSSEEASVLDQSEAANADSFFFPNFTLINSSTLNLVGYARVYTPDYALRLTSASPCCQGGAAWYKTKQNVSDGFETTFDFWITDTVGGGADGFAFVIQNAATATNTVGNAGCGIGYAGITDSLAIEFDTFANPPYCDTTRDPNGNHISVQTRGTLPNSQEHAYSLGTFTPTVDLSAGFHKVKISYLYDQDQLTGTLRIFVDNIDTSAVPSLTVKVDLSKTLGLSDGLAWVGFVAGTGTTLESHDILNWHFVDSWDLTCLEYDFSKGDDHGFVLENDIGVRPSGNGRGWRTRWTGNRSAPPVGGVAFQRGLTPETQPLFQNDEFDPALVELIQSPLNPKPIKQVRIQYFWSPTSDEIPGTPLPSGSSVVISIDLKLQNQSASVHLEQTFIPGEPNSRGWLVSGLDLADVVTQPVGLRARLQLQNTTQVIYVKKLGVCYAGGAPPRPPVMPQGARAACNALLANLKTRYQPFGPTGMIRQPEISPSVANLTLEPYFEYNLNVGGYPPSLAYDSASYTTTLIACAFMQNGQFYDPTPASIITATPIVRFTAMGGKNADQREQMALLNYAGYFSVGAAHWCYPRDDVFATMNDRAEPEQYGTGYNVPPPRYRCDDLETDDDGITYIGRNTGMNFGPCGSFVGSLYRAMGYFNVIQDASLRPLAKEALSGLYYAVDTYQNNLGSNSYGGGSVRPLIVRTDNTASTYITRPVSFSAIRVYPLDGCSESDIDPVTGSCVAGGTPVYGLIGYNPVTCTAQSPTTGTIPVTVTLCRRSRDLVSGHFDKPITKTLSPIKASWPTNYDPEEIWRAIKPGDIAITIIERNISVPDQPTTQAPYPSWPLYTHIQIVVGWGPAYRSTDYIQGGKGTWRGAHLYLRYADIPPDQRPHYVPYVMDRYSLPGTGGTTGPRPFNYDIWHTSYDFWVTDYQPTQTSALTAKTDEPISGQVESQRMTLAKTTDNAATPPPPIFVPGSVVWSPNGSTIALGNQFGIALYTPGLTQAVPLTGAISTVAALAWSPDSTKLASAETAQQVSIWNVTTGNRLAKITGFVAQPTSVAWSPDGSTLAVSSKDGAVRLYNANTFALLTTLPYTGAGYVEALAWSPNGDRLAASDLSTIYIWNAATSALTNIINFEPYPSGSLSWTPDGQFLITPGVRRWNVSDGQLANEYRACSSGTDTFAVLSPDGHKIAGTGLEAAGSSACVIQLDDQYQNTDQVFLQTHDGMNVIGTIAWSPDSQRVAFSTQNGWLYLSEATSGTVQAVAPRLTTTPYELDTLVHYCVADDAWYSHLSYLLTSGDYVTFINEVQVQAADHVDASCKQQLVKTGEFLSHNPLLPLPAATTPQPLVLESLCTSNMNAQWTWHVRNPNSYEATVDWGWEDQWPTLGGFSFVVPAASGSAPGEWFITMPAQPMSRTLKIMSGSFVATALNKTNCTNVFLPVILKGF